MEKSPERIGRYEIRRVLGKGAMGVVYLAHDPQIDRELALKTIRFSEAEGSFNPAEAKARFLKEARISGRLQHPHIVTVFDVGEDGGTLFLAMEYVPGGSLSQRLADPESLSLAERVRIISEVAEALAHAHERGVLHRDVKPANILLTPHLEAKVTDFGIGKLLTGDTDLTSTGQMVGSPAYMSPEQIKGDKLDARTDIFSLGVVLYQAITLRKPFPADTLTTLVYQILHEEPPEPSTLNENLPEEYSPILHRCLAKKREDRYQSAAELATDLRHALGDTPVTRTTGLSASWMPPAADATAMSETPTQAAPAVDADSPTITAGKRMGEEAEKAEKAAAAAAKGPPKKKAGAPVGLLVAGAVVLAGIGGLIALRKGGEKAPATAEAGAPSTAAAPAPETPASAALPASAPSEPTAAPTPASAPEKKGAKAKESKATPTHAPGPTAAPKKASPAAAAAAPTPAVQAADATYSVRRLVKLDVSPIQARVFLDGKYIGICDDWDDAGGGALLFFRGRETHRVRFAYPGYRDLLVDLVIRPDAADDKVEVALPLQSGKGEGPPGPAGDFKRPNYRTVGPVVFKVEPPETAVSLDGKPLGPASKWESEPLELDGPAVHDVVLSAPGHETVSLRVLAAQTTGEARATIREKLKK